MKEGAWARFLAENEAFTRGIRELPVQERVEPGEVREELERLFDLDEPVPLERLVGDTAELLRRWTVHVTHPRYFGLFNPGVHQAGVIGDALAATFNPQLAAWSHAPFANEIERLVLRRLTTYLGWQVDEAISSFTSGGAEANLSATLAAIAAKMPESAAAGLAAGPASAIYLTGESHHSFVKIARMTGLGTDVLRPVAVDDRLRMDVSALRDRIASDCAAGRRPLMIVGTAGTTAAGVIDPLVELADVAAETGAWLHVDGAWGASATLSPRLRPCLAGIERADSVTWDAHKWLSVPMGAGMFFCRHPDAVRRAFAVDTSYMPAATSVDAPDPYAVTAQWSRRAIGLKVFLTIAERGIPGVARAIESQADRGDELRERLRRAGWEIVNSTPLPVICFTHPDIRSERIRIRDVLDRIAERGRVWISEVELGGRERALRACVTSDRTSPADLDVLMDELGRAIGR